MILEQSPLQGSLSQQCGSILYIHMFSGELLFLNHDRCCLLSFKHMPEFGRLMQRMLTAHSG